MPTQQSVHRVSQLQLKILSCIADPVVVTDHEQHVVYWNGPSERLFGVPAEQTLGRRLAQCCPELWRNWPASLLLSHEFSKEDQWCGEVLFRRQPGPELWLDLAVRLLTDNKGTLLGFLWIGRDVTQRKVLEAELEHCRALLRGTASPSPRSQWVASGERPAQPEDDLVSSEGARDVVLWAEDDENDAVLFTKAWRKAEIADRLVRVRDGVEVIEYLTADGAYQDRGQFPLPRLLLLDIKMPRMSGLEVIEWLKAHPAFAQLRVVLLTSSAASSDIQEAARMGVAGYLVKPCTISEWVYKAKTVTSLAK